MASLYSLVKTVKRLTENDYQFLLDQVASLRNTLNKIYSQPLSVKEFLIEALERDGKTARNEAQEVINNYDNDN